MNVNNLGNQVANADSGAVRPTNLARSDLDPIQMLMWVITTNSQPMPLSYVRCLAKHVSELFTDKYKDTTYKMMVGMPNHFLTTEGAQMIEAAAINAGAWVSAASNGSTLVFLKEEKCVMIELFQAWMTGQDRIRVERTE